mgnify:FL=1
MTLATHVRTLGRGPGRSRSLTREEATDAMQVMLSGDAAPEAIGALLMLMRMKGETADEIAGFAWAAQQAIAQVKGVALDWPSYAAGRTRGAPWFLDAARRVADAGHPVLIHGWNGGDDTIRNGLAPTGIFRAETVDEASRAIARDGIAYLALETAHPALYALLKLRAVLGLRSCVNTVCRMLNPGRALASVQGVFHPSYRLLQADAAQLLGWNALSVIKGGGGEFERNPAQEIAGFGLRNGAPWQQTFPALSDETRRMKADTITADTEPGDFERAIIEGTVELALQTLAKIPEDALMRNEI